MTDAIVTRFAPSPTGHLHLGHAYAAIFAHDLAKAQGGRFLLRIEDIDQGRVRPAFEKQIYEDLTWLGLMWEKPVRRQSDHMDLYRSELSRLSAAGLTYPCFCTRKDIQREIKAIPSAPHGPEGALYPGTCRHLSETERAQRKANGDAYAIRLNVEAALGSLGDPEPYLYIEDGCGPHGEHGLQIGEPHLFGDIVLGRKDVGVSYHLAVTVDDHRQGVTHVTRGEDLFHAAHIQRLLQELLGYTAPIYHHHKLILHNSGRRLAKRDQDLTIKHLREEGITPAAIRQRLGLPIV